MTLPTSGPLSLSDIQTEFGGSNPISLNEYYAGGSYVPSGTTGTYGAVPTSGAISIQNFYGTQASSNTFTLVSGNYGSGSLDYQGFSSGDINPAFGSRTPSNITAIGGAKMLECYDVFDGGSFSEAIILSVSGDQRGVSWTSMTVKNGATTVGTFNKSSAGIPGGTYINGTTPYTYWEWTAVSGNPFPSGSTRTVIFA